MENLFGGVPGLLVLGAWGVGGRDYSDTNLQRMTLSQLPILVHLP